MFKELVYADYSVENIIKKEYAQAQIVDASDYIHTERFELSIADVSEDEFYPFAISEGFAECCLGFNIMLQSLRFPETKTLKPKENKLKIESWIATAKDKVDTPTHKGGEE